MKNDNHIYQRMKTTRRCGKNGRKKEFCERDELGACLCALCMHTQKKLHKNHRLQHNDDGHNAVFCLWMSLVDGPSSSRTSHDNNFML